MKTALLPQLAGGLFLSDGGLETTLVYLEGVELPYFAASVLLNDDAGRERLRRYYRPYLELCAATRSVDQELKRRLNVRNRPQRIAARGARRTDLSWPEIVLDEPS